MRVLLHDQGQLAVRVEHLNVPTPFAYAVCARLTSELWHKRLAHSNHDLIRQMATKNIVRGLRLDTKNDGDRHVCDACELGRKKRATFPPSPQTKATDCNAVVHSDVCGPIEVPALDGAQYVLLFVDVHSRYCHVKFLRQRSEFLDQFVAHHHEIENQQNRPLVMFVSDNGGEYVSDAMKKYCKDHGVQRGTTVPHTPEQNGIAEVRFRILLGKARTLLIDADLPKQFWKEAVATVVYIQNRLPSRATKVTPHELWFGSVPDVSVLRVFGSLCYVHLPRNLGDTRAAGTTKRQKLDYRAVRGVFLGYANQQKGWVVMDCESGSLITSIHVTFDETESAAARELRRQELTKLSKRLRLDFDYYSRDALVPADCVFFGERPGAKASRGDLDLLEEFVRTFDLADVHLASTALAAYAPRARVLLAPRGAGVRPGQQVSTTWRNPLLRLTRAQAEAEAIVAVENMDTKRLYDSFVAAADRIEPATYKEAVNSRDAEHWVAAINKEIASLEANDTWSLASLPAGKRALTSRWLLKIKRKADGSIERYKARLVIRGFEQREGVDYEEIFAPVVRLEALRVILALVCIDDLECHQMDIETAFLNGTVEEEIYMEIPEGMTSNKTKGKVCRLRKSLYGLKQAPRAWHKALTQFLRSIGFEKLMCEACVYTRDVDGHREIVAIYVDDLLIVTREPSRMQNVKAAIANQFKSKDLGPVHFNLGLKVERDRVQRKMWISQQANATGIINKFNMAHANPVDTPTASGVRLRRADDQELSAELKAKPFRQAVGTLMYLMIGSRPDLAFAITNVSSYLSCFVQEHWEAVKRVLRYVKGTPDHCLEYGGDDVVLSAHSDSDYAGDVDGRKSVSGYVTKIGGCTVTWSSRKQRIVATSTAEAEYIGLAHCAREVLFLRQLLKELGYEQREPTLILEDNQACIAIAENPAHHARTKHIDVRYHFVRERIERQELVLDYVPSKENTADVFTKGLDRELFQKHRAGLRVVKRTV